MNKEKFIEICNEVVENYKLISGVSYDVKPMYLVVAPWDSELNTRREYSMDELTALIQIYKPEFNPDDGVPTVEGVRIDCEFMEADAGEWLWDFTQHLTDVADIGFFIREKFADDTPPFYVYHQPLDAKWLRTIVSMKPDGTFQVDVEEPEGE